MFQLLYFLTEIKTIISKDIFKSIIYMALIFKLYKSMIKYQIEEVKNFLKMHTFWSHFHMKNFRWKFLFYDSLIKFFLDLQRFKNIFFHEKFYFPLNYQKIPYICLRTTAFHFTLLNPSFEISDHVSSQNASRNPYLRVKIKVLYPVLDFRLIYL